MSYPESQPLLPQNQCECTDAQQGSISRRQKLSEFLESERLHKFVIFLIAVDATCVLADLSYTFLSERCLPSEEPDAPVWLRALTYISLSITTFFLVEIPLALYAFGCQYYNPFGGGVPHSRLHLFDGIIIVTTFTLEAVLKGKERELAGLLITFRLWRLIKLVGGIAVGAGELQEETERKLADTSRQLQETLSALAAAREENEKLRKRTATLENGVAVDDTSEP